MRHILSETFSGLRRNASAAVAILVTMAVSLTLFGVGLLAARQVELIKGRWYDKVELAVFLCTKDTTGQNCTPGKDPTDAQRDAVRKALESNPEVSQVFYESRAEVFEEFKIVYKDRPILREMTADQMQDKFRVKLVDPQKYQGVVTSMTRTPGVQAVQDLRVYLDPLFEWLDLGRWAALGASVLLLLAAALQIANTIRMAAWTRRRELGIMRLVGAGTWFIMVPFLAQALFAAVGGALLACLALAGLEEFFILRKAQAAVQTIQWIGWSDVGIVMLALVGVAIVLSIVPTLTATRRFLRV
jgi:cell division transport system permease protein